MAISEIHPDAKALIKRRIEENSKTLEKSDQLIEYFKHGLIGSPDLPKDMDFWVGIVQKLKMLLTEIYNNSQMWEEQQSKPIAFIVPYEGTPNLFDRKVKGQLFIYKNIFYSVTGPYDEEEARVVLLDDIKKKKEKAQLLLTPNNSVQSEQRSRQVPESVRHEVWRRDQGRCVECGSNENLEFDHIIPWSKGGANTARNLQLLCKKCNRNKSDHI